jgi:aminomethyltransferase
MPRQTPFHPRTAQHCTSLYWKVWAGHHAVSSFDTTHEREYFAIRHASALIDVSPLYKYEVSGPDAAAFLSFVMARDLRKLRVGRVTYLCWCDDAGKVVDDGTVARLDEDYYRVTAAEPSLGWLFSFSRGYDITIEDSSERFGALSLQGPTSRGVISEATGGAAEKLKFFRIIRAEINKVPVFVSRTGYTGDLGYEIWAESKDALAVWDGLADAGRPYRLQPVGLDAMDISRIEAGFIMNGVDYFSANHCLIESRKSSPYEIGLGRTVDLEREAFVGQKALRAEVARGPIWTMAGLEYDWDEFEALFDAIGLPPQVPASAWRTSVPIYDASGENQIGQATSGAWSPTLKKNLALATIESKHGKPGTRVRVEVTVEYTRRSVAATVTKMPFFNPERKRA